jgi:putative transcriptional regulator
MPNVKLTLETVLSERNKSKYALAKETKIAYSTIHKLATKDVKFIDLTVLNKICENLNCRMDEIIPIRPKSNN